jgi:hypothetical protein
MRMSLGKAGRHHCGVQHLRPSWVGCNGTGLTHGMHAPRSVRHKYGEPAQLCSISITAFAAELTPRCCAGFVYGFPAGCRVPTPMCNACQPFIAVPTLARHGCMADWSPEIADPLDERFHENDRMGFDPTIVIPGCVPAGDSRSERRPGIHSPCGGCWCGRPPTASLCARMRLLRGLKQGSRP